MDIRTIRQMLEAIGHQFDHMDRPTWGNSFNRATPQKRTRRLATTHYHGRGESKKRRRMAARSNRINRQRIKRWRH